VFHLVAMAASAGGLSALAAVLEKLPRDFPLPIAVVQHVDPDHESFLAGILGRRTKLRVMQGEDGARLDAGTVYVAPPGTHMEVEAAEDGAHIRLMRSEPVHFLRPSADRLFVSAAAECSPVLAVVLTGNGSDGAFGTQAIKAAGGTVIAQSEASAQFVGMPHAAIATGVVDYVLPLIEIAPALLRLTARSDDDF